MTDTLFLTNYKLKVEFLKRTGLTKRRLLNLLISHLKHQHINNYPSY